MTWLRLLAALLLTLLAATSSHAEPALWVASSPTATVYLFGTVHMLKQDLPWRSPRIDHAIAVFGPGLNLLTGETGAGKSILVDALSLLMGGKASTELVRHGVPHDQIDIQAFGDTHPLVPTAAGVREPQNRRVEIIIK